MYSVSGEFLNTILYSHQICTRLDICDSQGNIVRSDVYAEDGDVTIDATRTNRRDCSFTIPDYDGTLVMSKNTDLLSPNSGYELRPWRGVVLPSGAKEYVPLGVFPIRSAPVELSDGIPNIKVGGIDRSSTMSRNQWTDIFNVPAGTLENNLNLIFADRMPGYPTNFPVTGWNMTALQLGTAYENDPWEDASALAYACGYDLYFDANGVATISQPSDPLIASPVYSYESGATTIVDDATKEWDGYAAYNGVVFIGQNSSGSPIRAIVWDDDPSSATYYLGPYGKFPKIIVSTKTFDQGQIQQAAQSELARIRGASQKLAWSQVVNPALDANDCVSFKNDPLKVTTATNVVIDSVTIPWRADGSMEATTRARQVTA